jgi:glycosyltransferase involved in cell wall biosynthesis
LPLLEASASGLPVITTNWSGHLDFMKLGKFIPVDFTLVDIPATRVDNNIFMAGTKWAQPLEADFKKRLAKFKESYITPRQWAEELAVKCQKTFSRSAILDNYAKLTDALGIR